MNTPYKTIVVALECSAGASCVLEKAASFSEAQEVKLHFVHVVLDLIMPDWSGSPGQVPPPLDRDALAQSSAEYLKPMIESAGLDPNGLTVCFGQPAHEILERSRGLDADLLIAGSHSRKGLEVLLGSTAHKLLNLSHCDVLLVRTPKGH